MRNSRLLEYINLLISIASCYHRGRNDTILKILRQFEEELEIPWWKFWVIRKTIYIPSRTMKALMNTPAPRSGSTDCENGSSLEGSDSQGQVKEGEDVKSYNEGEGER
jgi:hypothetical protein